MEGEDGNMRVYSGVRYDPSGRTLSDFFAGAYVPFIRISPEWWHQKALGKEVGAEITVVALGVATAPEYLPLTKF